MKKIDKIFTIICISFLVLLEFIMIYVNYNVYASMVDTMNAMNEMDIDMAAAMSEFFDPVDYRYEMIKKIVIYSVFILSPLALGLLRFRFPKTIWMGVVLYAISGLYLAATLLFLAVVLLLSGVH